MVAEGIPTKYVGMHDTAGYTTNLIRIPGRVIRRRIYFAAFLAEVEVDTTGKTRVLSMKCVADVGVIGSKLAVDGQAYGGMMHGIGMALVRRLRKPEETHQPGRLRLPLY
jgi:aldehyde oxidoreductase